jgi:alpha-tubulin suppressor-like RCC1 family protein
MLISWLRLKMIKFHSQAVAKDRKAAPSQLQDRFCLAEQRFNLTAVLGDVQASMPLAIWRCQDIAMLTSGWDHALALFSNGSVTAWATDTNKSNLYGQAAVPAFPANKKAVQVAAGANFSVALLDDGSLMLWGDNTRGQTIVPDYLKSARATAIAAGTWHWLAALSNGTVAGAGWSVWGQLNIPYELLVAGADVVEVAAGAFHSLARTRDGHLYAWGDDHYGQVAPPPIVRAGGVLRIAAGFASSFALLAGAGGGVDGNRVVAWGDDRDKLSAVQPLTGIVDMAAGETHIVVLQNTGAVRAFGFNSHGQVRGTMSALTAGLPLKGAILQVEQTVGC